MDLNSPTKHQNNKATNPIKKLITLVVIYLCHQDNMCQRW